MGSTITENFSTVTIKKIVQKTKNCLTNEVSKKEKCLQKHLSGVLFCIGMCLYRCQIFTLLKKDKAHLKVVKI